jgi:hypothetical protein
MRPSRGGPTPTSTTPSPTAAPPATGRTSRSPGLRCAGSGPPTPTAASPTSTSTAQKVATVDTYSQAGKNFQEGLYSDTNPPDGQHTLDVVVTRQENPASTADTVVVDALDLHGTDDAPVGAVQLRGITVDRPGSYPVKITYINPDAHRPLRLPQRERRDGHHAVVPTHRRQQLQQRRRRAGAARSGRRWQHADVHQRERTGPDLDKISSRT